MLVFAHRSTIPTTSTPQYHYQCAAGRLVIWNVISVGGMPNCQCVRHACLVRWPENSCHAIFSSIIKKFIPFLWTDFDDWYYYPHLTQLSSVPFFSFSFCSSQRRNPFCCFLSFVWFIDNKQNWKHLMLLCCAFSGPYIYIYIYHTLIHQEYNLLMLCPLYWFLIIILYFDFHQWSCIVIVTSLIFAELCSVNLKCRTAVQ